MEILYIPAVLVPLWVTDTCSPLLRERIEHDTPWGGLIMRVSNIRDMAVVIFSRSLYSADGEIVIRTHTEVNAYRVHGVDRLTSHSDSSC